ncbi:MAG: hypothetical protein QOI03_343, partial [Solirubrobacteraceae bacterium]|nr:hypothetical protein [Solirubrobacteraceae bacterium]
MERSSQAAAPSAQLPSPPSELRAWLLACAIGVLGVGVAIAALTGAFAGPPALAPPPVLIVAPTPVASPTAAASALAAVRGSSAARRRPGTGTSGLERAPRVHIPTRWMEGFYPIYETAQSTFGVNWLLLASIHMQETAFSTAPSTYHGLNFAHCCGGPMQFNVTNGRVSTWDLVARSYVYARRPSSYDHPTATHPSIYDDFDAIMAASHLLSASGAGYALDGSAWAAAYDYYGHDASGVAYADEVLARAIGWSQRGFCINCGVQPAMLEAVHAAYGAPVLAALQALPAH